MKRSLHGGKLRAFIFILVLIPNGVFGQAATVDENQFFVGGTWTWAYSQQSSSETTWEAPYLYETYQVVQVEKSKVTIEMSSRSDWKNGSATEPHHKFVVDIKQCLKRGKSLAQLRRLKIQFFTKSFGNGWQLVSKNHKALAFTEKFNCFQNTTHPQMIDSIDLIEKNLPIVKFENYFTDSWYLSAMDHPLAGVMIRRLAGDILVEFVE